MKKIFLIDDDAQSLETTAELLDFHFQTVKTSSPKKAVQIAVQEMPDLILLDLDMPEMNGFQVCAQLRKTPAIRHIPIIMLTAEIDLDSRVKGLDEGADDYVNKPFQAAELLARIRARLRDTTQKTQSSEKLIFGNLSLDPKSQLIEVGGKTVKLTKNEYRIFQYFMERPNKLISRANLLGDLWPDSVVTARTIDTHMAKLRRKLKGCTYPIETVYSGGYILKIPQK